MTTTNTTHKQLVPQTTLSAPARAAVYRLAEIEQEYEYLLRPSGEIVPNFFTEIELDARAQWLRIQERARKAAKDAEQRMYAEALKLLDAELAAEAPSTYVLAHQAYNAETADIGKVEHAIRVLRWFETDLGKEAFPGEGLLELSRRAERALFDPTGDIRTASHTHFEEKDRLERRGTKAYRIRTSFWNRFRTEIKKAMEAAEQEVLSTHEAIVAKERYEAARASYHEWQVAKLRDLREELTSLMQTLTDQGVELLERKELEV